MKATTDPVSQRLLRKGALVDETYQLFQAWRDDDSFDANFERVHEGNLRTLAWGHEIRTTLRRRFRDVDAVRPLIVLARGRFPLLDWRQCLLLRIAASESVYADFAMNWLFPEYESGRFQVRTEDVLPHLQASWARLNPEGQPLSPYGTLRTARDLVRMARDLGVLEGDGPAKTFASIHLSDEVAVYACHAIAEYEASTARVATSELWRAFLLDADRVHALLLRLHQFRKLDYQIAGSLVLLSLPCGSALEYAQRMVS